MITYTTLTGRQTRGEVWSPGPLYNTVWVLCEDGGEAVVHATKMIEVKYGRPTVLGRPVPAIVERQAVEIVHAWWLENARHISSGVNWTAPDRPTPTRGEYLAAQSIIGLTTEQERSRRIVMEAKAARVALSDARLRKLSNE